MTRRVARTRRFLTATASVGALALLLAAHDAAAQTTTQPQSDTTPQDQAAEVDEIVVTGFRASLANALNIKRNEAGVVDAISAEDIADFPDTNLAESIQRIPGVSIDRDAGEGRSITVRGLSSEFTRTRINGIEAQATTGATDSSGGVNRGRGFDFNVFASELFNNITVRKTQSAETEEGSLGATVDLRTSRPFDRPGFNAALSGQYGYNDLSEDWSPRIAGLVSNTWADGQLGALFSLAYSERDSLEEGFSSVRWGPANADSGFQNPTALPGGAAAAGGIFHPRIPRYGRLEHSQERLGATLSFQARPGNGPTLFTFDALYSKLDSTRSENFLQAWSLSRNATQGGKPEVDIRDVVVDPETGEMVYAVLDDMDIRSENRFDVLETEFKQMTLNIEHEFSERLRFNGLIGRAESQFGNPVQVSAIIDRQNTDGYSWDFRDSRDLPLINYGFDVANPASWSITGPAGAQPRSELRSSQNFQDNVYTTVEGNLVFDLNDAITLKAGVNRKTFQSDSRQFARPANNNTAPALPAGVTLAQVTNLLEGFGRNLDLPAGSATSWVRPDLAALDEVFRYSCRCDTGVAGGDFRLTGLDGNTSTYGNWRDVQETDTGFYVQADWNTELWSMPFRGNVGVRQAKTEIEALGYSNVGGIATPVLGENEYDDTLPSLNVSLEPFENFIVRFGAAKVMSRPPLTSLVPVFSVSAIGAANRTASLGNVELEPYRAKTYDLSLEWYFAPEALLSFAYFYKDISTYVQTTQQNLTYAQLTALNPVAFPADPQRPTTEEYVFSTPSNTPGGPLDGFEISYQQTFTFLPGLFGNIGTQLNYTHVESEIDYCTTSACNVFVTADLVNLSPDAWNATLYYDDGRFNARVSAAYRDSYFQSVPGSNGGTRGIPYQGKSETTTIDASASYNVTDNLSLTIEGLNLTDEENRQNHGDLGGPRDSTYVYHHTGRQVYLGARYRF
ncbi:TonB-dependent receptor [Brevundimonas sp. PAMC22021]|uniref:TonB-dependent receptor n=1 Tax=Brevundimonas sp. PAMC22021 TaxID=2861285 RepID=UPI001C63740C|nr:TonB-dependent receptor [Brevundimonas sp. PAMC22021]QYF87735.1 TonB-dependent receptor [Brevundimonas sp. PAMC22021]